MRGDRESGRREEPPPIESSGQLERMPRRSDTATAMQQMHLHLTLEHRAAQSLRGALERNGIRVGGFQDHGRLLTSFCVDVATLDLQKFTGTVRVCSCEAFER